jgi:hypothetical protein
MSGTPTEQAHDPIFREIDLSAEIKKIWGARWNSPELAYEFSNGRKFYLRTEDAGIYTGAAAVGPGGNILMEDGSFVLEEDGSKMPIEFVP